MQITTDTEVCMGAGQCALTAPELFDQNNEDGTVELLQPDPPPASHRRAHRAAQMCPTGAIHIQD